MLNRKTAPPIKDATEFGIELPGPEKRRLRNGVDVYLFNMGTVDTFMLNLVFQAGNSFETRNLSAAAANFLLKNGTSTRNAFQINEFFEYHGAYLSRHAGHEHADITLHGMTKHLGELLPVLAELLADSTMPEEELAIYKQNMQQRLKVNLKKNDFIAGRLIDAYLFGKDHPYGRYSSLEEYAALDVNELRGFYKEYYQQGRVALFVAGRLPENTFELLDRHFGGLPLKALLPVEKLPEAAIAASAEKKFRIINDPDGVQGAIRLARPFPNRHHPDFQKMQVLNNLFGGYFGSRLMMNIREDKGYTYGIHSYLASLVQDSAFLISTEAGKDVSEETIKEIYIEMKRMREEPVDADELMTSRNAMIGSLLGDLDGPFPVAARWKTLVINGFDEKYFYRSVDTIRTLGAKEIQELAVKYLNPEDFYELVVV